MVGPSMRERTDRIPTQYRRDTDVPFGALTPPLAAPRHSDVQARQK